MADARLEIEVPEELLQLLDRSKLAPLGKVEQVRLALAIHLFLTGDVSIGKAADLAGKPKAEFEQLLLSLGLPIVLYDREELERDRTTLEHVLKQRPKA